MNPANEPREPMSGPAARRSRPPVLLVGIVLGALLLVALLVLLLQPWTDGGAEPVEAPGVAPSAPLPER